MSLAARVLLLLGSVGTTLDAGAAHAAANRDFAGLVDIGGGRKMYLDCRGTGSPTVVLVAGLRASAEDWNIGEKPGPRVFPEVAKFTKVCAYDRPGTPVGDKPSRSDPVSQPTTAATSVADLHALLRAAGEGPYMLVAHSYGGLIARLYASTYPDEVAGLLLVDALSEGIQDAETPEQWAIQRKLIEGDVSEGVAEYPALERIDVDRSLDQVRRAAPLPQIPLIVLSADRAWGPQVASMIAAGALPADVPPDFGYVTDAAQKQAQEKLAQLVPNAEHVTQTNSGHDIHKEQPQLVIDSIRELVDAVRDPTSWPRSEMVTASSGKSAPAPSRAAGSGDFGGLVDIGGGRKIYLECRGAGSPKVVLVSGKGNGAADWSKVLDPADPVHNAPFDAVGAGEGRLLESEAAVFPAVSHFTRVCAYDRPGTSIEGADISTPVAQPHRVDQDVDDLQTLLGAAGEPGPYVLVAHSYGGLVALLYARLHPEEVAGLIMVDAASELIRQEASAEELTGWDASYRVSYPAASEAVELLDAIGRIEAAPSLPERPAVVLSADKPWQSPTPGAHGETSGGMITFAEWLAAQDPLAASLHAAHVSETHSGHNIYLYQPGLVVDAIRKVVDNVRAGGAQGLSAGFR